MTNKLYLISAFALTFTFCLHSEDILRKYHDTKRKEPEIEVVFTSIEEIEKEGKSHPLHNMDYGSRSFAVFFLHGFPVNTPFTFKVFRPALQPSDSGVAPIKAAQKGNIARFITAADLMLQLDTAYKQGRYKHICQAIVKVLPTVIN